MFKIFADTHKIIAMNVYDNIFNTYGIKLEKETLLWGSISPDILPQYKFHRHYKKESLNYIVKEIMKVIFVCRYLELNKKLDPLTMKILSKKIGIISHYLSDFVCLPHAERWTFTDGINIMVKHMKYESQLDEYAVYHDFNKNIIDTNNIDIYDSESVKLKNLIKNYLVKVIKEYSLKQDFKNDLDFAVALNTKISYFIFDTIAAYSEELNKQFAFEF